MLNLSGDAFGQAAQNDRGRKLLSLDGLSPV
jgi:hypothetical protein